MFNFSYCERGEERASLELKEEISALKQVIDYVKSVGYEKITLIGKSLGGIVASYYLRQNPDSGIRLIILGYVLGEIDYAAITDNLKLVIQGEVDRFATPAEVCSEVKNNAEVVQIDGADHSYCDSERKPVYQGVTIEVMLERICESDDIRKG